MKRDIIFAPQKTRFENWQAAFPRATYYEEVIKVTRADLADAIIWVHHDLSCHEQSCSLIDALLQTGWGLNIVVLADAPDHAYALQWLAQGVVGYCHALSSATALKEVRAVVNAGGVWLGQDLLKKLILATSTNILGFTPSVTETLSNPREALLNQLTQREREVALGVAQGMNNKEIAETLQITERTVKAHMSAIFDRLQVKDRLRLSLLLNRSE